MICISFRSPTVGKEIKMPKEKKRGKKAAVLPVLAAANASQDDDDNMSTASDMTCSTAKGSDDDGMSEIECYESKIKEAMDLALEKSVQTRVKALDALTTALQKRVMTSFLIDNYITMTDLVERALNKGKGSEMVAGAKLGSLMLLTLATYEEAEQVYHILQPLLLKIMKDPSATPAARQQCTTTLALSCFLACQDVSELQTTCTALHAIYAQSLPKGNGELPTPSAPVTAFHAAAVSGFCLLISIMSPTYVYSIADRFVNEMFSLLGSADVDMRITAGEAVALAYELARKHDDDYSWKREEELSTALNDLATDSQKFRAKKDRKQQRASFRDVIRTVDEDESPYEALTIGPQHQRQHIELDSWSMKLQYQALCNSLAQGVNHHFTFNVGVRNIYDLGPPPLKMDVNALLRSKVKRPNHQSEATKSRIRARNKTRDNRADDKEYYD